MRDVLGADDLHRFGGILDDLTGGDGDLRDVARAALKVAHEATAQRTTRSRSRRSCQTGRPRRQAHRHGPAERGERRQTPASPAGGSAVRAEDPPLHQPRPRDHIRPGDLVGAIANESDLTGKDIGPINVAENFSTVDVPAAAADAVIAAIKQTTIRGKRASIRRDRNRSGR